MTSPFPAPSDPHPSGDVLLLGRYRLGPVLGVGGFATVYRAIDERFESGVAVKVLAENHTMNFDVRERFLAEALIQRRLSGAGVAAVHDLGQTSRQQPFTVMALADGGDLLHRVETVRAEGRVPTQADAMVVAESLARSVGAMHAKGIVHRDLKPSNLLIFGGDQRIGSSHELPPLEEGCGVLEPFESLLLGDLGFAKHIDATSGLTVAGGTPGFRPPEQETIGTVDYRVDVYGASAVLYWLLTNTSSPKADECEKRLRAAGVTPEFARTVADGLAADADDRQPSIEAWISELRAANTNSTTGRRFRRRPRGRTSRLRMAVNVVVSLAVLAGALAGGWWLNEYYGPTEIVAGEATYSSEEFADGKVMWRGVSDGMTVTILGPSTLAVGETSEFVTSVRGVESFFWIGAGGEAYEGTQLRRVTGSRPGVGKMSVTATSPQGDTLTVTAEFDVVDGE